MDVNDRLVLNRFKNLLSKNLKVKQLVLFGSRARGDADPDSDMDILVILDNHDQVVEKYVSDCAWEAGIDDGIVICPIIYSTLEWESDITQYSLLAKMVREEGVPV